MKLIRLYNNYYILSDEQPEQNDWVCDDECITRYSKSSASARDKKIVASTRFIEGIPLIDRRQIKFLDSDSWDVKVSNKAKCTNDICDGECGRCDSIELEMIVNENFININSISKGEYILRKSS